MKKAKESREDYLETILILSKKTDHVRSVDIAREMDFSKPSVSIALKKLRESGHVEMLDDGEILLTEKGQEVAERTYDIHLLLSDALESIGVPADIAREDACRIEHIISPESIEKIRGKLKEYNNWQKSKK